MSRIVVPPAESPDHRPEVAPSLRVETGRGLVQEQQLGVSHDAQRDIHTSLLTTGELAYPHPGLRLQPNGRQYLVDGTRGGRTRRTG